MSKKKKEDFEKKFQAAVSESLQSITVSDKLRAQIMEKLEAEPKAELPDGVDEEVVSDFQEKLSDAVHRSQEWSPEDEVALRTEAAVSQELKENVLSERSVGAIAAGAEVPEALAEVGVPEDKLRFVKTLRSEVKRSTGELTAPDDVRGRVVEALAEEKAKRARPRLIALPTSRQWKRGLSALTTLAAGFAVVFITLFGSAEAALASSVRSDHQNCCRASGARKGLSGRTMTAMLETKYGSVPVPPVDGSWTLRVSKVCLTDDAKPMIHQLYNRENEDGQIETMSLHFLPNQAAKKKKLGVTSEEPEALDKGDFPVVAWSEGDWVCTACSPELSEDELKKIAGGL